MCWAGLSSFQRPSRGVSDGKGPLLLPGTEQPQLLTCALQLVPYPAGQSTTTSSQLPLLVCWAGLSSLQNSSRGIGTGKAYVLSPGTGKPLFLLTCSVHQTRPLPSRTEHHYQLLAATAGVLGCSQLLSGPKQRDWHWQSVCAEARAWGATVLAHMCTASN